MQIINPYQKKKKIEEPLSMHEYEFKWLSKSFMTFLDALVIRNA